MQGYQCQGSSQPCSPSSQPFIFPQQCRSINTHPDHYFFPFQSTPPLPHSFVSFERLHISLSAPLGLPSLSAMTPSPPPRPPGHSSESSRAPIQDRWHLLKDVIEHQYINEKRKLPDLAEYMKVNHNFDAGYVARATSLLWFLTYHAILYRVHQYKYQFKKWNLRKNVPSDAKTHIGRCLQTRAEAGRASTTIQYKGHNVDPEKIRRYLKDKRRQDSILKVPASNVGVVANARLAFGKNYGYLALVLRSQMLMVVAP